MRRARRSGAMSDARTVASSSWMLASSFSKRPALPVLARQPASRAVRRGRSASPSRFRSPSAGAGRPVPGADRERRVPAVNREDAGQLWHIAAGQRVRCLLDVNPRLVVPLEPREIHRSPVMRFARVPPGREQPIGCGDGFNVAVRIRQRANRPRHRSASSVASARVRSQ